MKIIIIAILIAIIASLARALYYLVKKREPSAKMVKALTWRISLSIGLFILVIVAFFMGWIQPHGITPPVSFSAHSAAGPRAN